MEISLAQKAVNFALQRMWEEAVKVNLEILKESPEDTEALNRLARAYSEIGDILKARQTAQKVLKIDPVNSIAIKCVERWKSVTKVKRDTNNKISIDAFLEEPGRTKLVSLFHTGDPDIFANLDPGEEVKLVPFAHSVTVVTYDSRYIGRLPDDIAARLKNLIKSGNKYQTLIKSVEPKNVTVFIREMERGLKSKDTPSFPQEKIDYVAFTPPELVHTDQPLEIGENLEDSEEI
ncbi:MAG TPA: tetratricopeptide repeat protein [Patescibacteria group bacterium]|nr:tetratricopeptide repeat protein [Patescibacteria group bacterium]